MNIYCSLNSFWVSIGEHQLQTMRKPGITYTMSESLVMNYGVFLNYDDRLVLKNWTIV